MKTDGKADGKIDRPDTRVGEIIVEEAPPETPIIGPAWDKKNFWLNEGHSFGVTAAGGDVKKTACCAAGLKPRRLAREEN